MQSTAEQILVLFILNKSRRSSTHVSRRQRCGQEWGSTLCEPQQQQQPLIISNISIIPDVSELLTWEILCQEEASVIYLHASELLLIYLWQQSCHRGGPGDPLQDVGAQEGPCTHNQMRCASSKKPMKVNGESLEKKFAPSHSTANTRSDQ